MLITNIKTGLLALIALLASFFSSAPAIYVTPIASSTKQQIPQGSSQAAPIIQVATSEDKKDKVKSPAGAAVTNSKQIVATSSQETAQNPAPIKIPTVPVPQAPDWNTINERARSATVNIVCTSVGGGSFAPLSGSGVIVDPRGVILTNAHLGQYFLLRDYPTKDSIDCVIRQGSPAVPRYRAELFYLSPGWLQKHREDILLQEPLSTGENDFALLAIKESTEPSQLLLPSSFPFLEWSVIESPEVVGRPVIISAYPASFLGGVSIQTSLYLSSAPATIQNVFTFSSSTVDILALGGTVVSQRGSSGGAVVGDNGKLLGIVVTSSDAPQTSGRELYAITLSHIDRALLSEAGKSLSTLLLTDIHQSAEIFNQNTAPTLTGLLLEVLERLH